MTSTQERLFEKKIVDEARVKLQKEGLGKVNTKELIVIIADHLNREIGGVKEELKSAKRYLFWVIFGGIVVYVLTRLIP